MINLEATLQELQMLSPRQQKQVVDFIAFLRSRDQVDDSMPQGESEDGLAKISDLVGCIEGPTDLSTNPAYMQGFGQ